MFVGCLEVDILLGDVHSLKEKRSLVRPVIAELQRFGVSAAETGDQDLHRRAEVGVAVASSTIAHLTEVLDRCERAIAARPELQILSVRRRVLGPED